MKDRVLSILKLRFGLKEGKLLGESPVSYREEGERHRTEGTEDTEGVRVEAKWKAPAQTELRPTCAETSRATPKRREFSGPVL